MSPGEKEMRSGNIGCDLHCNDGKGGVSTTSSQVSISHINGRSGITIVGPRTDIYLWFRLTLGCGLVPLAKRLTVGGRPGRAARSAFRCARGYHLLLRDNVLLRPGRICLVFPVCVRYPHYCSIFSVPLNFGTLCW